MFRLRPHSCERAHEWASLRLDGELSEFERVLLDSHLRRCGSCAAYVREIGAITETIRATALEPLRQPIVLPLRRRSAYMGRVLQAGAATAAVIAATVGLSTHVGANGRSPNSLANAVRMPASAISSGPNTESDALLRVTRLANLRAQQGIGLQRGIRIDA